MGFPAWEGAVRCSSGPQPGVLAFTRWFMEEYGDKGGYNLGIYNCRDVRGADTTSLHGEGRALDAGFPVGDPDGNELLRRLLRVPGRLGIQCIIYERQIYSRLSPEGRAYDGVVPHLDHLHIEFTWEAATNLTYRTVKTVLARPKRLPGTRDLRLGMKGADVRWLQNRLNMKNVDGYFGDNTKSRVLTFEKNHKDDYPRLEVDGVVGPLTWKALGVTPKY
jgi:hypothetical protein